MEWRGELEDGGLWGWGGGKKGGRRLGIENQTTRMVKCTYLK